MDKYCIVVNTVFIPPDPRVEQEELSASSMLVMDFGVGMLVYNLYNTTYII